MESIPILYLAFVLLGCLLAIIAIWSRKKLQIRVAAVGVLIVLVLLNYTALIKLLGLPQPVNYADDNSFQGDSVVLAASIDEGVAIYLWLRHRNHFEPRYYRMEWDEDAAIALKKAMDQSLRENKSVMMKPNYESSLEQKKEPLFYALPHERMPLKPPPNIYEYRNPNKTI